MSMLSRRRFIGALGAAPLLPALLPEVGRAQTAGRVLPLDTPGVDHLDVIASDPEATARFYMGVFNTHLHGQPFQGAIRYFILLSGLGPNREVGYIAIGAANGRDTEIGHFCTSVPDYRQRSTAIMEAMAAQFGAAGFGEFSGGGGFGGIFADPDGIEIQFLPSPDVLVTAAVPSDLVEWNQGMVTPRRLDHVLLHVSDLDAAVRYYRILYGPEAGHRHGPDQAWFGFADSRIILEEVPYGYGAAPKIAHYCVQVEAFDSDAVATGITALGGEILPSADEPEVLRILDPDGNTFELKSA